MGLYKRGDIWWANASHNGHRVRTSTGTPDKQAAQRFYDELKAKLWTEPEYGNEPTWRSACVYWLKAAERSESDRYSLRALDQVYPDRPLPKCTRESFEEALADKTPATFNRYRAIIQAVLHLSGIRITIPLRKTKSQRIRFLTREEWDRLYEALPPHLKPLASFALATGLRQYNVTHLKWSQVDLARKVAWIHPDEAKAGKAIGIPLSDAAISVLEDQLGKSPEWVFPYKKTGKPITKIKTGWQLAMEKAGLGHFERSISPRGKVTKQWQGDFTWHGLRHTWAAWHVMSGTPLEVVQKLGGWADLKMVLQYAHLAPEYLASYSNNAKPWDAGAV